MLFTFLCSCFSLPDQQQYASNEQSKLPDPSRIRSRVPPNMPKLFIPSTVIKFPPEITVTPPTPTLLSPKGSISEETKQRLKVSSLPLRAHMHRSLLFELRSSPVLNSDPCCMLLYRTSSCRLSLQPQSKRTLWASRRWRCRRHPAKSHLWRASRTRRTITWTSEFLLVCVLKLNCQTPCPCRIKRTEKNIHVTAAIFVDATVPSRALQKHFQKDAVQPSPVVTRSAALVFRAGDGGFSLAACL